MHSLLARDFANAVVNDRVRFARSKRTPSTESAFDAEPERSVKAVVRPSPKTRSREAEAVCV